MSKFQTAKEIVGFLKARKKYWLAPIFVTLVFLGLLIALGEASGLGPFVYPFF